MNTAIRIINIMLLVVSVSTLFAQTAALSARDYFNELKAANNFNHYKDEYVCFRDDDVPTFVVIAKGSTMIEHMKKAGQTPGKALLQAKDDLFLQSYYKGVAAGEGDLYIHVGKEGTDYEIEFNVPIHGRMRYSINWLTGHYRLWVFDLGHSKTLPAAESSGKCELIHPEVP